MRSAERACDRSTRNSAPPRLVDPEKQKRRQAMNAKALAIGCVVLSALFSAAADARGGGMDGGMHRGLGMAHSSSTGGAFGSTATAPGTNSLGTALPGGGSARAGGPLLGTGSAAVDREDRKAAAMVNSICRGC
jgi:hypothetical protein